jgi:hypothetical protein
MACGNQTQSFGYRLHQRPPTHFPRAIDLTGVAQIPTDVVEHIEKGWEDALTADQMDRANAIIWDIATKEIQHRHRVAKTDDVDE